MVKSPSDFIGSTLGESEKKTSAILDAAVGKVLVIDEAYGLYARGADPYRVRPLRSRGATYIGLVHISEGFSTGLLQDSESHGSLPGLQAKGCSGGGEGGPGGGCYRMGGGMWR